MVIDDERIMILFEETYQLGKAWTDNHDKASTYKTPKLIRQYKHIANNQFQAWQSRCVTIQTLGIYDKYCVFYKVRVQDDM